MTREEIIEGLKLLEDNMVYFDELLNDKGEYIDVHELLFESIEALSAEPCEDCISRAEAIKAVREAYSIYIPRMNGWEKGLPLKIDKAIYDLPSIQPKPKTGHWKKLNVGYGCSECSLATNKSGVDFYRFCPNCGAKMESEGKE